MDIIRTSPPVRRVHDLTLAITRLEITSPDGRRVNIIGFPFTVLTPGANVEFTITHNLGYIPRNLISLPDVAAITYASRKNLWTTTQAFLKCSQAAVNLEGFIF